MYSFNIVSLKKNWNVKHDKILSGKIYENLQIT